MRQSTERLLEVPYGLAVGRARHSLLSCLPAVRQGLVPHLPSQSVMGQAFDLLGHLVPRKRLEGNDDASMEHPPTLLEETAIGHLVGEGVLESIDTFWEEVRLVEELGRLEGREATM